MASAEELLHEAQYAFQCISFGDTRENRKHAARAQSLARKIIRKYPNSSESSAAHSLLRRLGQEAYTTRFKTRHNHAPVTTENQHSHNQSSLPKPLQRPDEAETEAAADGHDLTGLIKKIWGLPRPVLWALALGTYMLYAIMGPLVFLMVGAILLFAGPLRKNL